MEIERPEFVFITGAFRYKCDFANDWKSKREPYHQGEIGILHNELREFYQGKNKELIVENEVFKGFSGGVNSYGFDRELDYFCIPNIGEGDRVVVLFDNQFPRADNRCEGFYSTSLIVPEFVKLPGESIEDIVRNAKSQSGARGVEKYDLVVRNLLTFDLRFKNRLNEIPLEYARAYEIPEREVARVREKNSASLGRLRGPHGKFPELPSLD